LSVIVLQQSAANYWISRTYSPLSAFFKCSTCSHVSRRLQLLNSDGAASYKGDGKQVVVFGGVEIMPTLEQ
jgi:hypothetical protein